MRVLITGALGGAAQGGIIQSLEKDFELRLSDYKEPEKKLKYEFIKTDIRNYQEVKRAVKEVGAIVHLGAIANPNADPILIYQTNIMGTANLLEASLENNIKKFIYASSIHVYGIPIKPEYLPIDEEHPLRPSIPYALSKLIGEELGRGYVKKNSNFTFINLRIGGICHKKHAYSSFKLSDIGNYKRILWTHIHAKDLGQLVKLSLLKDIKGFEVFNAFAQDHLFPGIPSLDIMKRFFPKIKKVYNNDEFLTKENRSFISIRKAKDMLGYQPEYNFTDYQKRIKEGKREEDYYFQNKNERKGRR